MSRRMAPGCPLPPPVRATVAAIAVVAAATTAGAAPQAPAAAPAAGIDVPPVTCWWQADRGAVRVGERFVVTLTCALVATGTARAELEEAGLAASSLRLTPFDVLDGERSQDVERPPWRFLQHRYTLRVIGEDLFGKDVVLPRLQISYRVSTALQDGALVEGRQQVYWLPPLPVRVLSLVPREATDILDAEQRPFAEIDARHYRAQLLLVGAAVALGSALLVAAVLVALTMGRRRARRAAARPAVSSVRALRVVARELRLVEDAAAGGWTPHLAARAAAALRLAGAVALGRPIAQRDLPPGATPREGEVAARVGWRRPRLVLSAAVTPSTPASEAVGAAVPSAWQALRGALALVSAARYQRAGDVDPVGLGDAVAEARRQVRVLQRRQVWRRLWTRRTARSGERATPAWAR